MTTHHLDEKSPNPVLTLPAREDIAQCDLKVSDEVVRELG
jgi:hypothetical protein